MTDRARKKIYFEETTGLSINVVIDSMCIPYFSKLIIVKNNQRSMFGKKPGFSDHCLTNSLNPILTIQILLHLLDRKLFIKLS